MKAKTNENERWCRIPAQPKVKTEAFSHFSDDEEEKINSDSKLKVLLNVNVPTCMNFNNSQLKLK